MNRENFDSPAPKPDKPVTLEDKILAFEQIKTPVELLANMTANIQYGFIGKKNNKTHSPEDKDWDSSFIDEYSLQSPEELISSGHGVCWDITELERDWFAKHGYNFKVFFMMFVTGAPNDLPTHTFLAFEDQGKWYWFEHSFGEQRGIHEYASLEELIADVKKKQLDYVVKNRGANIDDYKYLKVCEYETPTYGSSSIGFVEETVRNKIPLGIE